jgi:cytochrome c-type biogenesis protein CcmF
MFLAFISVTVFLSVFLVIYRWKDLQSEGSFGSTSLFSREALFLLAALLFIGVLIICIWGVHFPLVSEILTGQKVTVGPPFYIRAVAPLFAFLLLLMGIAPLSSWTYASLTTIGRAIWKPAIPTVLVPVVLTILGLRNVAALIGLTLIAFVGCVTLYEFGRGVTARSHTQHENIFIASWHLVSRNRRRYGGYVTHLGMVMMGLAIIGIQVFQTTTQKSLAVGESLQLDGYTIRYESLAQFPYVDGRIVTRAVVSVLKNGKYLGELHPRYDYYPDGQPMTIPAIRSTLADDLYIILVNWEDVSALQTPFRVYHNPLVIWLWIGSFVFVFGTLVAAWPERERKEVRSER